MAKLVTVESQIGPIEVNPAYVKTIRDDGEVFIIEIRDSETIYVDQKFAAQVARLRDAIK